ncbi:hypothetical protein, partial [uncultured Phocaeicola sp.]|uniref:hypothetical protein n=1 Tax=uncultured Phocaeicola sp. TaxID=990718 RepID=UPI0026311C5F
NAYGLMMKQMYFFFLNSGQMERLNSSIGKGFRTLYSLQPDRPHSHLMPVTIISMNYERFRKMQEESASCD